MITFIVFALMMGYLVYRAFGTNFELVEEDYYKDELRYQQVIDGTGRSNMLNTSVQFNQSANGITLQMPEEMKNQESRKAGKLIGGRRWFVGFLIHFLSDQPQQSAIRIT